MALKKKRMKKSAKITIGILSALIVVLVSSLVVITKVHADYTIVDDFSGKTKEEVMEWVEENSISVSNLVLTYDYDEEIKKDYVISQSLEEGTAMHSSDILVVDISKGGDPETTFELPDFSGKTEEEVKSWFTKKQFTSVSYNYEQNDEKKSGDFISMSVEAGTTVKRSENITVTICDNNETEVTVPDLQSYSLDDISAWASKHNISINFEYQYSEDVEKGKMISISTNAGDKITSGSSITVVVSNGKQSEESDANTTSVNNFHETTNQGDTGSSQSTPQQQPTNNSNTSTDTGSNTNPSTPEPTPTVTSSCKAIYPNLYAGMEGDIAALIQSSQPGCTVVASYDNSYGTTGVLNYSIDESTGIMYVTILTK